MCLWILWYELKHVEAGCTVLNMWHGWMGFHLSIQTAFKRGKKLSNPLAQPETKTWIEWSISTLCSSCSANCIFVGFTWESPMLFLSLCLLLWCHFMAPKIKCVGLLGLYEWKMLSNNWISAAFNLWVILALRQSMMVVFLVWNIFQRSKNTHALKSRGKGTRSQRHNSHRTPDIECWWRIVLQDTRYFYSQRQNNLDSS